MKQLSLLIIKCLMALSFLLVGSVVHAMDRQQRDTLPKGWQFADPQGGPYFGINLAAAKQLLHGRAPVPIIAGIVDSGIDTLHHELKGLLWQNPKDKAGNNRDEDHDGYKDDHYGWSFLGSAKGNVCHERLELTRMVNKMQHDSDTATFFRALYPKYLAKRQESEKIVANVNAFLSIVDGLAKQTGKSEPTLKDFESLPPQTGASVQVLPRVIAALKENNDFKAYRDGIAGYRQHFQDQLDYDLNLNYEPRTIVGDHPDDPKEKYYGSPDVSGPDPLHGTHVAGIIASVYNNGQPEYAATLKLLAVRAIPDGDERDKDVANAIRFAVDHGAKVINMSFGKGYSPEKPVVDEAVAYAIKKDVLLIHAAGNDHLNIDAEKNFPTRNYEKGGQAAAWIEVGASGAKKGAELPADFSNYGKQQVDLFAPGVDIWSTLPGEKYGRESGTSMACPVVCGIAALIRSYFPKLSALQVKDILLHSVIIDPGVQDKCTTGGVINAAKAVQLALQTERAHS